MNKRLIHIIVFSFCLLLGIQIYINVKLYYESTTLKLNSVKVSIPMIMKDMKKFGFKDILELSEENKNIKIVKLSTNSEDKTKGNVEIEYNGATDSFNDILILVSSKENVRSINSISITTVNEFKVKAVINMDFIKNK